MAHTSAHRRSAGIARFRPVSQGLVVEARGTSIAQQEVADTRTMPTLDIAAPEAVSPSTLISWLGQLPEPTGRDRRAHERLLAQELDWLRSARLRFGPNL